MSPTTLILNQELESSQYTADLPAPSPRSLQLKPTGLPPPELSQEDVDGVEKFVFFIGYARSGSSIVASMMDSHPNMIISHECKEFHEVWLQAPQVDITKSSLFKLLYRNSYKDSAKGVRSAYASGRKGYLLGTGSSWQGRFSKLSVIGDKQAGRTTMFYATFPSQFEKKYHLLVDVVKVPIYVIHVVRNPFDIIATRLTFSEGVGAPHKLLNSSSTRPVRQYNTSAIKQKLERVFALAKAVQDMIKTCNLTVLHVHAEELVRDPKGTIRSICDFLELDCPADYVQQCHDKAFTSVSRTRDLVDWSPSTRRYVEKRMKDFSFFSGYAFQNDFWTEA